MAENGMKIRDSLADLEKYRLQLEQNIAKLRASLRHWQTWEIEYEGMKEEILELGEVHSCSDLENIGDAQNELLTPKERKLLLLDDRGNVRESHQVIGLLSRRIDYVQQNIRTISSLLNTAQEKYAATQVLSQPEVRNEEGLPLTEIHEELDEEGHVISSSISEPGQAAPQLLENLRKAGVKDLPSNAEEEGHSVQNPENTQQALSDSKPKADSAELSPNFRGAKGSDSLDVKASEGQKTRNPRKSVSFTADTKTESLLEHKSKTKIPTVKSVDRVIPVDGFPEDEAPRRQPVIPVNESSEDAALRRQMIQYSMSEVNNIVAEININDEASNASYSDTGSEEIPDDSSLDEDEDKFGRTKRRVLSDDYLAEMRALEQRLGAKAIQNVGPNAPLEASTLASGQEKVEQRPTQSTSNGVNKALKPPASKGVRFAEELDSQTSPPPPANAPSPTASQSPTQPKPIHANTVIERPYSATSTAPAEPDEFDPALLQQEVKTEYHKMRNRMIQRQGGFTAPEDGAEVPLTEAEGGPKKMSRFKAARLGRGPA
ncbi:hypothetical protein HO133_008606 [Letharia lupina]|uniref:DUF3835 domain-containing protein n=1 Tax=Letharia lupina TaxID=560253 RepID=A0A8H6FGN6_9LECA|nr:uncharacterized protein HO133_008606 [Letharia lupina]KAF6227164.1 hypothetical protein HO133_008606 [Letharia lupina]